MTIGANGTRDASPAAPSETAAARIAGARRALRARQPGPFAARVAAVLATAAGLVAIYEVAASQIAATTADASTALLEGQAIISGNVILHGWALSLDSFWALDALWYAVALVFVPVRLSDLHLVPALIAAAIVVTAGALSRRGLCGRAAIGAVVACAVLALPSPTLTYYLLQGPWHVATTLASLGAFALCHRRGPWWRGVLAAAVLALGMLSDLMTLVIGVAPVLALGCVELVRTRRLRRPAVLFGIGCGAVAAALAVRSLAPHIGMFSLADRVLLLEPHRIAHNAQLLLVRVPAMFGVGRIDLALVGPGPTALQVVRGVGFAGVLAAVAWSLVRAGRAVTRLRRAQPALGDGAALDVLVFFAAVADLAFFVVGSANGHVEFAKYLTAGVVFLTILAARTFGAALARAPRTVGNSAISIAAAIAVVWGVQFGVRAVGPAPVQPTHALAAFLQRARLGAGVASYPIASLITVDTSSSVLVRPIQGTRAGSIEGFDRQRDAAWYAGTFRYLVYDTSTTWHDVSAAAAVHTFGPYDHRYTVGTYAILVWDHGIHVPAVTQGGRSPLRFIFRH